MRNFNTREKKIVRLKGNIQARTLFNSIYLISSHSKHFLGASRGFAFVTFSSIDDAKSWIEMKQVVNGSHARGENRKKVIKKSKILKYQKSFNYIF